MDKKTVDEVAEIIKEKEEKIQIEGIWEEYPKEEPTMTPQYAERFKGGSDDDHIVDWVKDVWMLKEEDLNDRVAHLHLKEDYHTITDNEGFMWSPMSGERWAQMNKIDMSDPCGGQILDTDDIRKKTIVGMDDYPLAGVTMSDYNRIVGKKDDFWADAVITNEGWVGYEILLDKPVTDKEDDKNSHTIHKIMKE